MAIQEQNSQGVYPELDLQIGLGQMQFIPIECALLSLAYIRINR